MGEEIGVVPTNSRLTVSLVEYETESDVLACTLQSLAVAAERAGIELALSLVNNGPVGRVNALLDNTRMWSVAVRLIEGHGNVGFGAGHNLALRDVRSDFHLILNPDVELAPDALAKALDFMREHPETGLLAPAVRNGDGCLQYLCKRYPSVLDLGLRGLAPAWLQHLCGGRLAHYEMRDVLGEHDVVWDPPIVSGCFMFFRTSVLRALGGFDPRYFLYFEDFDLSLRAAQITRIAYVPDVCIIHHGGYAARKGGWHVRLFTRSAVTFFNSRGWKWW